MRITLRIGWVTHHLVDIFYIDAFLHDWVWPTWLCIDILELVNTIMNSTNHLAWYSFPKVNYKTIRNANSPDSPVKCTDYSTFLPTIIVRYQLTLAFHCYFVIVCLIFAIKNVNVMLEYAYFMDLHFGAWFKHEGFGLIVVLGNVGLGTGSRTGWRIRFVFDDRNWDSVSMLAGGFRVVPIIICLPQTKAQAITTWWIGIKCTDGANV